MLLLHLSSVVYRLSQPVLFWAASPVKLVSGLQRLRRVRSRRVSNYRTLPPGDGISHFGDEPLGPKLLFVSHLVVRRTPIGRVNRLGQIERARLSPCPPTARLLPKAFNEP